MPLVLLTRPRSSSEALAAKVRHLGYQPVIEPLLTIVRTRLPMPVAPYQAVMITSGHVFEAAEGVAAVPPLFDFPCFCVGAKTAEKARAFGFRDVHHTTGDGAALADFIAQTLPDKTRPILHMAGQDVDSKAQDVLKDKGFAVTVWPLYAAKAATDFPSEALSFFRASTERAILVFSPRTAQTLVELIVQSGLTPACAELTILGLSAAVVKPLAALVWKNCVAVDPPTEAAVLAALTTYHPIL